MLVSNLFQRDFPLDGGIDFEVYMRGCRACAIETGDLLISIVLNIRHTGHVRYSQVRRRGRADPDEEWYDGGMVQKLKLRDFEF